MGESVTTTRFEPPKSAAQANGQGAAGWAPPQARGAALPKVQRQRRPFMAILAVLLIVGTAAVFASVYMSSSKRTPVLTIKRDVIAGQIIQHADLGIAEVAGSGVTAIEVSAAPSVIGKTAAVDLRAGTLLNTAMFSGETIPAKGEAVVGVALKAGFLPSSLPEGATVQIVLVPLPSAAQEQALAENVVLVKEARVLNINDDAQTGAVVVDLVVPADQATAVARAAATNTIGLVQVRRS